MENERHMYKICVYTGVSDNVECFQLKLVERWITFTRIEASFSEETSSSEILRYSNERRCSGTIVFRKVKLPACMYNLKFKWFSCKFRFIHACRWMFGIVPRHFQAIRPRSNIGLLRWLFEGKTILELPENSRRCVRLLTSACKLQFVPAVLGFLGTVRARNRSTRDHLFKRTHRARTSQTLFSFRPRWLNGFNPLPF